MATASFYLVMKRASPYRELSVRTTKKSPALQRNEVAMKLSVSVPDAVFQRPQLSARIEVAESAVAKPTIEADVIDNIEAAIKEHTGVDLKIQVEEIE